MPKDSVYGKRDGVVSGLAIISNKDHRSPILSTKGWKTGTVHGIHMVQRPEMYKPDAT